MIFARFIGLLSTIILVLFALASPFLLFSLLFIAFGYGGFLEAIVIGTFPVTTIYLQRAARNGIETKSYSKIYSILTIFVIHIAFLLIAIIRAQHMH